MDIVIFSKSTYDTLKMNELLALFLGFYYRAVLLCYTIKPHCIRKLSKRHFFFQLIFQCHWLDKESYVSVLLKYFCILYSQWWIGAFLTVFRKGQDTSQSTLTSRLRPHPPALRKLLSPNRRKRGKTLWVLTCSCIAIQCLFPLSLLIHFIFPSFRCSW